MLRDRWTDEIWTAKMAAPVGATVMLLLCALLLTLPADASAGCGGVEPAKPTRNVNPGGRAPLAIGDSTMLLALPNLAAAGYRVDAHGCRGWDEGMAVIKKYRRRGRLPHLVTIALGADYSISRLAIRRALRVLGPKRLLALVTPRELGGGAGSDADVSNADVEAPVKKNP